MYSTYNEGKSLITESFIRTVKSKIYKGTTANDSKSCLGYLNKLVDHYNSTYCRSIGKKTINADYSVLTEKVETNPKACKLKISDTVRTTKYKNIFSKGYTENWSKEIFIIESLLKTNPWTYKIKDLNGEKLIGLFYILINKFL